MPVDCLSLASAPSTLVEMVQGLAQVRVAEYFVVGGAGPASGLGTSTTLLVFAFALSMGRGRRRSRTVRARATEHSLRRACSARSWLGSRAANCCCWGGAERGGMGGNLLRGAVANLGAVRERAAAWSAVSTSRSALMSSRSWRSSKWGRPRREAGHR